MKFFFLYSVLVSFPFLIKSEGNEQVSLIDISDKRESGYYAKALKTNVIQIKELIKKNNIRTMSLYFPQFHEFEENNKFWGNGFTEWTLLNKYTGNCKVPHVHIGQYNMLNYAIRKYQGNLAKDHGINAFCYYHYWFLNKKVMYAGLEKILEDSQPDLPFTFCWANETWSRNWFGGSREILIKQEYGGPADWIAHYEYLSKFFKHKNYLKINNAPLFFIWIMGDILDNNAYDMIKLWKKLAVDDGFNDLLIVGFLGNHFNQKNPKKLFGFVNALTEQQPMYAYSKGLKPYLKKENADLYDSELTFQKILASKKGHRNYFYGAFFSWSNIIRGMNPATIFESPSYDAFENYLKALVLKISENPNEDMPNYIILNAWNEWSEQAVFEPNNVDGYKLLEIIKKYFTN